MEWHKRSGHNYFAIFWSGANLQKSPSTVLHALRTSDLPLSYSATTFGVGRIKSIEICSLEWGIFTPSEKSLRGSLPS